MAKKKKLDEEQPPVICFDCLDCTTGFQETYWSRFPGLHYCKICEKELVKRNEMSESNRNDQAQKAEEISSDN